MLKSKNNLIVLTRDPLHRGIQGSGPFPVHPQMKVNFRHGIEITVHGLTHEYWSLKILTPVGGGQSLLRITYIDNNKRVEMGWG